MKWFKNAKNIILSQEVFLFCYKNHKPTTLKGKHNFDKVYLNSRNSRQGSEKSENTSIFITHGYFNAA